MDRVRVGLSGLGAVFLLTLGVSLVFGRPDASPQVTENIKEPGEPLAQLGVAPSSEPKLVVPPTAPEGYVPPASTADGSEAASPYENPVQSPPTQTPAEGMIGSKTSSATTVAI